MRLARRRRYGPRHDRLVEAIGAPAGAGATVLVSDNVREFRRVEGLRVENWRRRA